MSVKNLQASAKAAQKILWNMEEEKRTKIEELESAIVEEYAERLASARSTLADAEASLKAAENAIVLSRVKPPYPVGTKVEHWTEMKTYMIQDKTKTMVRTGEIGLIEIVTPESQFSANIQYRRPSVGDIIVRAINKNGETGKKFYVSDYAWSENVSRWIYWLPIEQDMNEILHGKEIEAKRQEIAKMADAYSEVFGI